MIEYQFSTIETADRILARSEPLHPQDDDFDADYGPADDGETIDVNGVRDIPRDALKVLLRFLVPRSSVTRRKRWRIAQIRLLLLARMCDIDDLAGQSLETLAADLGCTRALLSLYSVKMGDSLGLNKTLLGKSRQARESFREAAIRSHKARGHHMADAGR